MLIRFVVKNLFSFKEQTEFNLLPGKEKRLPHHKYTLPNGIEVLKLSAIYGANGSGKSNLVKGLFQLTELILNNKISPELGNAFFKLSPLSKEEPIEFAIEFFAGGNHFYYTLALSGHAIVEEYLATIDEFREEKRVFDRKGEVVRLASDFDDHKDISMLVNLVQRDFLRPKESLFYLLKKITNPIFNDIRTAWNWFDKQLEVVFPDSKHESLVKELAHKPFFANFANHTIRSFNTGISQIKAGKRTLEEHFGKDDESKGIIYKEILLNQDKSYGNTLIFKDGTTSEELVLSKEGDDFYVHHLVLEHEGEGGEKIVFGLADESDGTQRLLDYLPAIADVINDTKVYVIDEMERSIHPSLIKELVRKFSADEHTKGQLIFTTHEANLLDQDILRKDEIWLTEKNSQGASTMYPLSNYKEHATIDIRKGYLAGRYGAIPFLGDLKHLNWHAPTNEAE